MVTDLTAPTSEVHTTHSPEPTVAIVIVNWNAGELLVDCLKSVNGLNRSHFRICAVVVVDNASTDGSLEPASALGVCTHIVRNDENRGFAKACNQGAQLAPESDYILFLNPDTRLERDIVLNVVAVMESSEHQTTAVCGVQMRDDDGRVSRTSARFPSSFDFVVRGTGLDKLRWLPFRSFILPVESNTVSGYVDHVIGAFYFVRSEVFVELDGFDERFFVYLEDLDFSLRASKSGWRVYFDADDAIYHKGGGSSEQVLAERLYYSLKSRLLFSEKHFERLGHAQVVFVTLTLEPVVRALHLVMVRRFHSLKHVARAYFLLWRSILSAPRRRARASSHSSGG